jgi:hypothetical protein
LTAAAESPSHIVTEIPVPEMRAALLLQSVPPYPIPLRVTVDPPLDAKFAGEPKTMLGALKLTT